MPAHRIIGLMVGSDLSWAFASLSLQCLVEALSCLGGHKRKRQAAGSSSARHLVIKLVGLCASYLAI